MATSRAETDEIFNMAILDPDCWAIQARSLKVSAQLSLDQLIKAQYELPPGQERSDTLITFMQSYMLLVGYAIENIVKGLLIARLPEETKELPKYLSDKIFSHSILSLMPSDMVLTKLERNLLTRLQAFTVWAGRYPMSTKPGEYHAAVSVNLLTMKKGDPILFNKLFFKFDKSITVAQANWQTK